MNFFTHSSGLFSDCSWDSQARQGRVRDKSAWLARIATGLLASAGADQLEWEWQRTSDPIDCSQGGGLEARIQASRCDHQSNRRDVSPILVQFLPHNFRPSRFVDFFLPDARPRSDKTPLCVPFLALPSPHDYPDYYELIKRPTSLEQIRRRLQLREYSTLDDCRTDCEIVCRNAKKYNQSGSEIYEKARVMHSVIKEAYVDLVQTGDASPSLGGTLQSSPPLQQQSAVLARSEKPNARARLEYDDDDVVVLRYKKAGDLPLEEDDESSIAHHRNYQTVSGSNTPRTAAREMAISAEDDNATNAMDEDLDEDLDEDGDDGADQDDGGEYGGLGGGGDGGGGSSGKGRTASGRKPYKKRETSSTTPMELGAGDRSNLTLSGKFDRRKRPGPRGKRLKSSLRHIFFEIKAKLSSRGSHLSNAFWELPNRREYPDYYRIIAQPICMRQIEEKTLAKDYVNPFAFISSFRLMLDNAQYFNEEGSVVWTEAQELRDYLEKTVVPTLIADGFTMEPDDLRQSALPIELAANSTIPAQAAAYRIQMERRAQQLADNSVGADVSMSPETPSRPPMHHASSSTHLVSSPSHQPASASPMISQQQHGLGLVVGSDSPVRQFQAGAPATPPYSMANMVQQGARALPPQNGAYPPTSSRVSTPFAIQRNQLGPSPSQWSPSHYPMTGMPGSSSNGYFASPSQSHYIQRPPAPPTAPPVAPAGSPGATSSPFARPPLPHLTGPASARPAPISSRTTTKRLSGNPPPDPLRPFAVAGVRRPPVSPNLLLEVQSLDKTMKMTLSLSNVITRQHIVTLPHNAQKLSVRFPVRAMTDKDETVVRVQASDGESEMASRDKNKKWTIAAHLNGAAIAVRRIEQPSKESEPTSLLAPTSKDDGARLCIEVNASEVSVCCLSFVPPMATSVLDVNIAPPPPCLALRPLRDADAPTVENAEMAEKARALLDMPERYRVVISRSSH